MYELGGKEHITADIIKQIQKNIEPKMYDKILKDPQSSTTWIYETIKEICQVEMNKVALVSSENRKELWRCKLL